MARFRNHTERIRAAAEQGGYVVVEEPMPPPPRTSRSNPDTTRTKILVKDEGSEGRIWEIVLVNGRIARWRTAGTISGTNVDEELINNYLLLAIANRDPGGRLQPSARQPLAPEAQRGRVL